MFSNLPKLWKRIFSARPEMAPFPEIFDNFQTLLQDHQRVMELIADLGEKSGGEYIFDRKYLEDISRELHDLLLRMVKGFNSLTANRYMELYSTLDRIFLPLAAELRGRLSLTADMPYVVTLTDMPLDYPILTGGKANALGRIAQSLHPPVPAGFVITTQAYRRFLETNGLEDKIHGWLESWAAGEMDLVQTSRQIQYSILAGVVPNRVAADVRSRVEPTESFWAVRSSAFGEDGELSFAGLHESLLHVPSRKILSAYKKVLASLYSPEALSYRQKMGMLGEEAAMAVLIQESIPSRGAGVIHTLDTADPQANCLIIYAHTGWGRTVVEGRAPVDRYILDREPPYRIHRQEIVSKENMLRPKSGGGEEEVPVPLEDRERSTLSEESLATLASWALALERYFKRPQEIEWAQDASGKLWVLQSRGLVFPKNLAPAPEDICQTCSLYPILMQNQGSVAHAGVGSGPVYRVDSDATMAKFPPGAVLLIKYTAPWLARVVPQAAAIIAERGSAAGHLATIAREFRVPTLVGVEGAYELLREGAMITVDTKQRLVYRGKVTELLQYELMQAPAFEETKEFRLMRRLLKRIAPLHLIDPQAADFTPQGCQSLHDVIRFIHEKAVEELMDFPRLLKRFKGVQVWTLVSEVPIGLKILDLGGGIDSTAKGNRLLPEQICSLPLKALWAGISSPGVWSTEPISVDFKGMMSSLTKTWAATPGANIHAGFNLAVISGIYMNLHLRLGYHLNLIDARMHPEPQHNHIYFRFVGGVTDISRRSRRAQLLAHILSTYHFKVDVKGDLVVARVLHLPQEEMLQRLQVLGRLIGFTRQLDIQLKNDEDIPQFIESFFDQHLLEEEMSLS